MTTNARRPITSLSGLTLLLAIVVFFGFHIVSGDRGLLARPSLELDIVEAEEKLALLLKHQRFLEHRIGLFHGEFVDGDILAETARAQLGLYGPNDVIVSISPSDL